MPPPNHAADGQQNRPSPLAIWEVALVLPEDTLVALPEDTLLVLPEDTLLALPEDTPLALPEDTVALPVRQSAPRRESSLCH